MKLIRKLSLLFFCTLLIAVFSNCKKCKKEDPRARIINNGSQKASVQIQTSGGNTVNMNNVMPGSVSEFSNFAPGDVVFTVSVGNKTNIVTSVPMQTCYEYDIAIDENGAVLSTAHDRND
jgi:hypothetical protein